MSEDEALRLVALLMVAVLVVPAALRANRGRVARSLAAWLAIMALLALVYWYFEPSWGGF